MAAKLAFIAKSGREKVRTTCCTHLLIHPFTSTVLIPVVLFTFVFLRIPNGYHIMRLYFLPYHHKHAITSTLQRNLERQKARLLTKEEVDRLQELENKRLVRTV